MIATIAIMPVKFAHWVTDKNSVNCFGVSFIVSLRKALCLSSVCLYQCLCKNTERLIVGKESIGFTGFYDQHYIGH
jgi:hypothetical protein